MIVGHGAADRESALQRRREITEIGGSRVESLDDRHRFSVPTAVDSNRDTLLGSSEVIPDSEIIGKTGYVIKIVAHYNTYIGRDSIKEFVRWCSEREKFIRFRDLVAELLDKRVIIFEYFMTY